MSIELVRAFHEKFDLNVGDNESQLLNDNDFEFRHDFLQEELNEFHLAQENGDLVGCFDALLDLVYVAHGTALMMNISPKQWNAGMAVVQSANMSKVRAADASESKRGSSLDVIKPKDWTGPEPALRNILSN
jgi:predicted HAD superfamily Cof-like phosphohydrolase